MAIDKIGPNTLLSAITQDVHQVVQPLNPTQISQVTIYVEAHDTSTISSGVVTIEEASSANYAGTWSTITTITCSTLSNQKGQAIHAQGIYGAIRARVSTTIGGGGSVDLYIYSA